MPSNTTVTTELHVARQARSRYGFAASHFVDDGHAVFGDMHSVRVFAQEINEKRDLTGDPPRPSRLGYLRPSGAEELNEG